MGGAGGRGDIFARPRPSREYERSGSGGLIPNCALRCCLHDPFNVFAEQESLLMQAVGSLGHGTHIRAMVGIPLLDGQSRVANRQTLGLRLAKPVVMRPL